MTPAGSPEEIIRWLESAEGTRWARRHFKNIHDIAARGAHGLARLKYDLYDAGHGHDYCETCMTWSDEEIKARHNAGKSILRVYEAEYDPDADPARA